MIITIDTREQRPYRFAGRHTRITFAPLKTGDYSILGHEHMVAVERKSPTDFLSSIGRDRKRFFAELSRLRLISYPLVVVETSMAALTKPRAHRFGQLSPNTIKAAVATILASYRIPILFSPGAKEGEDATFRFLSQVAKRISSGKVNMPMEYYRRTALLMVCRVCGITKHEDYKRAGKWRTAYATTDNKAVAVCPRCAHGKAPKGFTWRQKHVEPGC